MKTVSKAVLSALLLTGVAGGALVAQPAMAQKKEKAEELKYTKAVLQPAQTAQAAIKANDYAAAEAALAQVDAGVKSEDDRYLAAALRLDLEQAKLRAARAANPNAPVDETALARPLDILLAHPRTDPAQKGNMAFSRGVIAYNSKQFAEAIKYWEQARQFGYTDPDLNLQIMRAREQAGDTQGALADLDSEIKRATAAGQKPPEDYYRYAISRAMKGGKAQALPYMRQYLTAYPTQKNWRDMLVLYGLAPNSIVTLDVPQKIDLFRLMDDTNSLADQYDYGEFAQRLQDRGLPVEAQKILKEGIAAGKIPANNAEYKAMQAEIAKSIRNEGSLTSLETRSKAAADGKLASQTADAYLSQANYAKAAELYRVSLQKGGVNADEVNTRLGIALARAGDKAGAKAAFAAVQGAPRKDLASFWMLHLDSAA